MRILNICIAYNCFQCFVLSVTQHDAFYLVDINKSVSYKQNPSVDVKYGAFNMEYHNSNFSVRANAAINGFRANSWKMCCVL